METIQVELNKKKYTIEEPTIQLWSSVMKFKDILDEEELYVKMIAEVLGITREEVLSANTTDIINVGDFIYSFINQDSKKLFKQIEFKGTKYNVVDINNVSFGQYVDIDTFLRKDEAYRIANLNEAAAYLYCEDGVEYTQSDIKKRIELFKNLPIKYVESSLFFLSNLGRASQQLIQLYSQNKLMWKIMKMRITLVLIMDGIQRLARSPKTKFGRLIMWCLSPLLAVSIIFPLLWIKIKKGKD